MYTFVKYLVRLGLLLFCRKIQFNNKQVLNQQGPLLLACNHPNSFFDALILGAYFKQPVHFLARGDAFKNPIANKILSALKAVPIYRLREGKEYLALNDHTFERCISILRSGGIVLIFSEGLCVNQWQLRSLKKGTARIALSAWKQYDIDKNFKIIPVSFNYSSFNNFNKSILINFSKPIVKEDVEIDKNEGEQIVALNKTLYTRLESGLVIGDNKHNEIEFIINNKTVEKSDTLTVEQHIKLQSAIAKDGLLTNIAKLKGSKRIALNKKERIVNIFLSLLLFVPAIFGFLLHLPLYIPINNLIKTKTKGTVFYHSALFGVLIIVYPIYTVLVALISAIMMGSMQYILLLLLMPLLAYIYIIWKDYFESVINYITIDGKERRKLKSLLNLI